MKHYVVLYDVAVDGIGLDEAHAIGVAHTLEEARAILAMKSDDEKEYSKEHGWAIYADNVDEFDAGEDGFYASEHAHYYIEEIG
jgi:hypothetical protein